MTTKDSGCHPREALVPGGCYSSVMRKAVAVVVFAAFAVGACAGSDQAASTEPTVAESATTVVEPVITTEVATTTIVETTIVPTTTVDDEQARLRRAAEEAYIAAWEATWAVFRDPGNSELRAEAEGLYSNANLEQLIQNIDGLIDDGYAAVESPTLPASATIVGAAQFIDDERVLVDLVVCEVNTDWFVEVGVAPDGSDALVRDDPVSVLIVARLEFVDDIWKPRGGDILSEVIGADTCDA